MKYALYGLPCAGKTTLLNEINDMPVFRGGEELNRLADGKFAELSGEGKESVRKKYAAKLAKKTYSFIADGHFSFEDRKVFTEADAKAYDVFLYLYCAPETIYARLQNSEKNSAFKGLSAERLRRWQDFEIEALREECHKRDKDFYVLENVDSEEIQRFINRIENGFSSYALAVSICGKIRDMYHSHNKIYICDGDKTIIKQDSFRLCTNDYVTHAFDGGFYTGYQAAKFAEEVAGFEYDMDKLSGIKMNPMVYDQVKNKKYIVLSSGIPSLWGKVAANKSLTNVIANPYICADTKFFVIKILRQMGYDVTAYGDGKNDLYMLKEANAGYLYIGNAMSRSLHGADVSGINLIYDRTPYIMAEDEEKSREIDGDVAICKSSSGYSGSKLRAAHVRLGERMGEALRNFIPEVGTAILTLERSGDFFGVGVSCTYNGVYYRYNPNIDELPTIRERRVIVIDGVINTGKSVLDVIKKLKKADPEKEIFVATNVIHKDAVEKFSDYKLFAVRASSNSYVGETRNTQADGKGPDTADRLYNNIMG